MAKNKYYAVRKGNNPGIYTNWDDCKKAVDGYSGAEYKGFSTKEDAEKYLGISKPHSDEKEELKDSAAIAYVDGSYNKELNLYGSGIVFISSIEHNEFSRTGSDPIMLKMWNVAGETEASMFAIQYAIDHGYKELTIYYDYTGIEGWANGWKANEEGAKLYKSYVAAAKEKIHLIFVKVDAHTGNTYNEVADQLAKKACKIK